MKIALLVQNFLPKWLAGTEIATYNIAKHLARRKHDVYVITRLDNGLPKEGREEGFNIHRILHRKIKFIGVVALWMKIVSLLKKIDPDIIHVQGIGIGLPAFFAKKLLRKPFVVWGQGSDIYLPDIFTKQISRFVLKNADAVIALTESMEKKMRKIYDREIFVIPNGINLEKIENISKENILKELKMKDDEKILLFVGSLRSVKGVKYLIESIKLINKKCKSVRLIIIGDGEERNSLEKRSNELNLEHQITFIGKVPHKKVMEYMIATDIFVLPSLSEGLSIVCLEAMFSGLPIIATKVGGLPEVVKDGRNGFLVEPKNPEEMAEKVLLLLEKKDLRKRISKNNREEIKKYDWRIIIDKLEKLYYRITG